MKPSDESAIGAFLDAGGRISRVKETVRVSEPELLDYLAGCGIIVRYRAGDQRQYLCRRKRVSASALVAMANQHRSLLGLPPFALQTYPAPRHVTRAPSAP